MKIIDAHIHTDFSHKKDDSALEHGIEFSWRGLQEALKKNGVQAAIAIPIDHDAPTPGGSSMLLSQAERDPRLKIVCSIDPKHVGRSCINATEKLLKEQRIYGLKIFPGYHPVYPSDKRYFPFYRLAGRYGVPVIIHTGDTFGSQYLVKYSHPLAVDEIAVKFPQTTFILAHLGFPWVREATELVYKNENVYADLSALCVGRVPKAPKYVVEDIRYAFEASDRPDKFLYGSDWPLVNMHDYIQVIKHAVPREHHRLVFYENAKKVFNL
ncbi:MAG: amidohydrolase family protein [Nanoarchaeota archaeon]